MRPKKVVHRYGEQQQLRQQPEQMREVEFQLLYHFFRRYQGDENTAVDEGMGQLWVKAFYCPEWVSLLDVDYCLYQMAEEDRGLDRAQGQPQPFRLEQVGERRTDLGPCSC